MKLISFVLLLHAFISYGSRLVDQKKEEFEAIGKYELIYLNLDQFESNNIIELDAYGQHYKIQLTRNDQIAPNVNHQTENELIKREVSQSCHYHGEVLNYEGKSLVAISLCDGYGVRGRIRAFGDELLISPADYYLDIENTRKTFEFTDQHLVYKLSDYTMTEKEKELTKGLHFISPKKLMDNKREHENESEQSSSRRRLAYNSGDNVVEIYILADKSFVDYFKGEADDWYSLLYYTLSTIINGASAEYKSTNWNSVVASGGTQIGNIELAWVALDVVEAYTPGTIFNTINCPNPCSYGSYTGSSAMLRKFGEWAQANKDVSDFDYGMVYTADDYFGSGGLSWVGGVCKDNLKYGWIGETGMSRGLQLVFAHELGHNFGMYHDNESGRTYYCGSPGYMRTPTVNDAGFTSCSLQYLRDYFGATTSSGLTCLARRTNTFTSNIDQEASNPFECVLIEGAVNSDHAQHNGVWTFSTYDANENRVYTKDGYYLYAAQNNGNGWWSISTNYNAAYSWSNLVCNWAPSAIYDCDGKWPSDDGATFSFCPADTTPSGTTPTTPSGSNTPTPVAAPTPTKTPTNNPVTPTPPPVDSPSGDCINVRGFTQTGYTQYNGQWAEGGILDGTTYTWYQKDGYYLYTASYGTNKIYTISDNLGATKWTDGNWVWSTGYCVYWNYGVTIACSGGFSQDRTAQFEACGALTSLAESHPCLVDSPYDDNLCFYQNSSMESQEPLNFEVTTDLDCINDYGVYRHILSNNDGTNSTYYLHRTESQWIISIDFITQYGAYFCDETDLLDCENGKWKWEVDDGDSASIQSNDYVMISSCPKEETAAQDTGSSSSSSIIISVVLVGVVLVVCGFCVFIFMRSRNKGKQSFETDGNQMETRNVGVSMDATAPQAEYNPEPEIEVEVPAATHTIE